MITFTSENPQRKIVFEVNPDLNATELVEVFQEFMLAVGYTPQSVEEALQ